MRVELTKEWCMNMAKQEAAAGDPDCSVGTAGAPLRAVAQVVALEPEGPDGHGVNWLAGKRPKPGDLLYAGDAAARAEPARDAHRGGDSYEASMLRNLLALIHGDGGQYLEAHGLDKALENAERIVAARTAALTELVALQDMKDRLHKLHEMANAEAQAQACAKQAEAQEVGAKRIATSQGGYAP